MQSADFVGWLGDLRFLNPAAPSEAGEFLGNQSGQAEN
jgi:hypothetical protein